jgi:hypothetical protein
VPQRAVLIVVFVLAAVSAHADQWNWEYFHPTLVTAFGCSVSEVQMIVNGSEHSNAVWEATAKAKRKGEQDWAMTVGIFPVTLKGRHEAEKACSHWMDQAQEIVRKSQKKP